MIAVLQRVSRASVTIQDQIYSRIGPGMLILLGIAKTDSDEDVGKLTQKIVGLRIFEDPQGRMNLANEEIGGDYLVVSQFTLCADTKKGKRPGFEEAMKPPRAEELYRGFCASLSKLSGRAVKTGQFGLPACYGSRQAGATMQIELVNDGPATFILDTTQ